MGTNMRRLYESEPARADVPAILRMAGRPELALRFDAVKGSKRLSFDLGDDLESVAATLERAAVDPVLGARSDGMNFATALRIYGPPTALRGEPLEWRPNGTTSGLVAHDADGTRWDIDAGRQGYGLTVAFWDRPDWWVETLELAKTLAAEIAVRPSYPRDLMEKIGIKEIPID